MSIRSLGKDAPCAGGRILISDRSKLASEISLVPDQNSFANSLVGYVNKVFFLVGGLMGWFVA